MPEKEPKALVLFIHGLGSHSGRIDHWAKRFASQHIGFFAYDQRGHGKSDEKRGYPRHIHFLIEDVKMFVNILRDRFPAVPLILYGHSMGGNVAINFVLQNPGSVKALICTSPWLKLANPPSATLIKIIKPLLKPAPGLTLSNGLDPNHISRDPVEVNKYKKDPLVHGKICIGLFHSAYKAGFFAFDHIQEIAVPLLLMHGTGDKITSAAASVDAVKNAKSNIQLKLWENAYHELQHEDQREEVFTYIINWAGKKKLYSFKLN